jgi:hypothetical protein
LRRWWRVLRSSLRCFFLAIRLRRFLMTEPMKSDLLQWCATDQLGGFRTQANRSAHQPADCRTRVILPAAPRDDTAGRSQLTEGRTNPLP